MRKTYIGIAANTGNRRGPPYVFENGHVIHPTREPLDGRTIQEYFSALQPSGSWVPGDPVEEAELNPGEYYPRIWRGQSSPSPHQCGLQDSFIRSKEQLTLLFADLQSIFRVVYPAQENIGAYGSAMRNQILLACTEVEAQWRGVLAANGASPDGRDFTTSDYVKLCAAMRLEEYAVKLWNYPDYKLIEPFHAWSASAPTTSLTWYDAYNRVKHDRERNFHLSTLENAVTATAACAVMLHAQFRGEFSPTRIDRQPLFLVPTKAPEWLPRESILGPLLSEDWTAVEYFKD